MSVIMEHRKIGFAFCGSFCTYSQAMEVLERIGVADLADTYP